MRILGGFDYYDGAGWSIDPTSVFVRNPVEHAGTPVSTPFTLPKPIWRNNPALPALSPGLAIVGGERFAFWEVRQARETYSIPSYHKAWGDAYCYRMHVAYHYRFADLIPLANTLFPAKEKRMRAKTLTDLETWLTKPITSQETDWLVANNITTLVMRRWRTSESKGAWTEINTPTLKDIDLYKVLDPATAHMRISSWISGVLPQNKPLVALTDKDRLRKAGFDNRSFRKDPQPS